MLANLIDNLVPRHRPEQCQKLLRAVQLELTGRRPHEETLQHGLAKVLGFEQPTEPGIPQPQPDFHPQRGLVPP